MKQKTNSPQLFNSEEIYKTFFCNGVCLIDIDSPMDFIYYLDNIALDNDKIILINANQENTLFDNGFTRNGTKKVFLDNLSHIYVQKYVKKVDGKCIYNITNLECLVDENCKYSNYLGDLIVQLESIDQISYEKIGEILEIFLGVKIPRQRVYELFDKRIDEYLSINITELQEKITGENIEFGGVVHYDEEFLWIKHQPYVRLTALDGKNKLIIADSVIPREFFSKEFIKEFLETSLKDLEVNIIVTDGYRAYDSIIDDLGFNHQRCTFHSMKNLMDKIIRKHNRLNRKINALNNEIKELKEKINEINEKYKGRKGRIGNKDKQRQKDSNKKKTLKTKLSNKKALKKKYLSELNVDDELVKKISLIFKSKTEKTARKRFNKLYSQLEKLPEEIKEFMKKLSKYFDKAIQHTINREIPSTNNLIEGFYKITLPGKIKRIFKTYRGLLIIITLNNIRWTKRCATINTN